MGALIEKQLAPSVMVPISQTLYHLVGDCGPFLPRCLLVNDPDYVLGNSNIKASSFTVHDLLIMCLSRLTPISRYIII